MVPAMDHKQLIEALGGHTALAAALGVDVNRVCQWKIRGVPSKRWHEVLALADAASIAVTAADLARTKPSTSEVV
jgi:DNA-binding transcriptional regulator YdaS (Cro superfamily)